MSNSGWNDDEYFALTMGTFVIGPLAGIALTPLVLPLVVTLAYFWMLGALAKFCFFVFVVTLPIGVAFTWSRAYAFLPQLFSQFGMTTETLLIAAPMLISLAVLVVALILTFARHKNYAIELLIIYVVVFIPYALIQCGGIKGIAAGVTSIDMLIAADLNVALSCGLLPALALFVFHKVDNRVQAMKRTDVARARAGQQTLLEQRLARRGR